MSSALVIGVGGLGCPAALELAENGVDLVLVDPDRIELSNLQRQILFRTADIGQAKVTAAANYLGSRFPARRIDTFIGRADADNISDLLGGQNQAWDAVDVVVDCTDDPTSRFVVGDSALKHGVPAVLGGVLRFDGLVLAVAGSHGPCFRCLFEVPPPNDEGMRCGQAGVLGALCGIVGHLQAQRALGLLGPQAALQTGYVTTIDGLAGRIRDVALPEDTDCPACGGLAARLDITAHACPMTFVRTRLALEAVPPGGVLDILMRPGEPARNVPRSLREEGHHVLVDGAISERLHRVVVRRAAGRVVAVSQN